MSKSKAEMAVVKARASLLISQPFFGCLALHLDLVECPNQEHGIDTMAVDGTRMYHYPEFVLGLTENQLKGVVAHETMHCAYKHMTRRGNRHPKLWNIAGDYVINWDIKAAGFELPGVPLPWNPNKPSKAKGYLYDAQFKGMSTEEVYERIKQTMSPEMQAYIEACESGDMGGCGGVIDAAGPGKKAEGDVVDREWDATVRHALNVAKAANAGTVPGHLERLVEAVQEPKVDWRELTRRFIDNSMKTDVTWARPSRRFMWREMILPGVIPDGMHHLIFVVDNSGSINDEMLREFGSEIGGALDDGVAQRVTVVYADTHVNKVDEYVQGDVVHCKCPAGGGTDFADTFNWIEKNTPDANCIVYLTDMMTSSFGHDVGIPTLWAAYLPKAYLANIQVPFGEVVEVRTD